MLGELLPQRYHFSWSLSDFILCHQTKQCPFLSLPLTLMDPVPSDIAISRAQTPKHIHQLAREVGILEEEV